MKKMTLAVLLILSVLTSGVSMARPAKAWIAFDPPTTITTGISSVFNGASLALDNVDRVTRLAHDITLAATKLAAILAIQASVNALMGDANDGKPAFVTNWDKYLYQTPHQRSMIQLKSFLDTATRGRASSLNYEGIGASNYDAYIVGTALSSVENRPTVSNYREYADSPQAMFAGNNMKAFMSFFECSNNPACLSMVAQQKYQEIYAKEQNIAEKKQYGGVLPKTKNGRVITPASLVSGIALSTDQLGNQMIANATNVYEIAAGAVFRIGSAAMQKGLASNESEEQAIRDRYNQPVNLNLTYNKQSGIGVGVR